MTNQYYSEYERESLERTAQDSVCAFQLYDLMDNIEVTTDDELLNIIDGTYDCPCDECILRDVMQC